MKDSSQMDAPSQMEKIPLLVIAGPTAVGKTDCAISIALHLPFPGEIISADSMQVYKYLNLGTAKPSLEQQLAVKHHLIDLVTPDQEFTVSDFRRLFDKTITEVISRGKLPILSGGTGLYIRASLQAYLGDNPAGADWDLRLRLQEAAREQGAEFLFEQLKIVDPVAAARIHPNDLRRVIRALEVYQTTGRPISSLQSKQPAEELYQLTYIFLERERADLYHRIDQRVDCMIEQGLLDEVRSLLEMGYSSDLKPMQGLGYRQMNDYLQKKCSWEEAVAAMKQQTRNYAKRQLTWFRKEPIDFRMNLTNRGPEFLGEILEYLEGRFDQMSNNI
ncbi:MAG TPA: tRNA (adenosine(37)-N6)-dimethylallyltransferase MiaA [Bacillota bacterium]|nr:tRNA (adenosine(37)-N6)-dimethylallyltransferase MiaA [Bacillota bacterium]